MAHTDIAAGDWIDTHLPSLMRPYARLMRLDRPIGTWLLLMPCWWSYVLAGGADFRIFFLFALGAIVMRGAGCAINDIWDRELDRKVERTRTRPLASGALSVQQAAFFVAALGLIGLIVLVQFNPLTFWLGLASLIFVLSYPLAKRFIWAPQLILGLTFNWGTLMGWAAERETLEAPAYILYLAGIFWTLAYDTVYAHQDKTDDVKVGIKSLALYFGEKSKTWVMRFQEVSIFFFALSGWAAGLRSLFYIGLILAARYAFVQLAKWNPEDPAGSLATFKSARDFGLIVFASIGAEMFL